MLGRLAILALCLSIVGRSAAQTSAPTPSLTPVITAPLAADPYHIRVGAPITFSGRVLPSDATGTLTFTIDDVPARTVPLAPQAIADYIALGDSITAANYIADPAQRYPAILAQTLNRTLFNYAAPGYTACDVMPSEVLPFKVGQSVAINPLYSLLIGTYDLSNFGVGAHEQFFNQCHQAILAWLGVAPANKFLVGANNGNTTRFTLTTTGAPAYLWYGIQTNASGSFTVSVDGAAPTPATATQSTPLGTVTSSYALLRFPIAAGTHTFDIVTQSGTVNLLGMGSPPSSGGPTILAGDIPSQINGDTTGIATYTADIQANIALLRADGLDIRFVPTQQFLYATPAEMMDSTNPNALGLSELAAAFQIPAPAAVAATIATASFATSSIPIGSHAINILYSGDTHYAPTNTGNFTLVLYDPTSTLALTSSSSTYPVQSPITLTATVPQSNVSGLVNFFDESGTIGSAWLNQSALGTALLTIPSLPAGIHTVTAQYLGDLHYSASSSAPLSVSVSGTYTTTSLSTSATRYFAATPVSISASVSPISATGTVTFSDGPTILGQSTLVAGTSTLTASTLAPGIHPLTAAFTGNATQDPSQSPILYLEIDPNSTTTALTPVPATTPYGTALQLHAAVSPTSATGTVTFSDGPINIGQSVLPSAAINIGTLAPGSHNLTATYSGDTNDLPSISSPVATLVTVAPSSISLAPIPASSPYGTPVSLLATVAPSSATGTVTFFDGSTVIGQTTLPNAALTIGTLSPGLHILTATYSGDSYRSASTSPAISSTIVPFATTITLAALPPILNVGNPLTLVANLIPSSATGTVLFRDATLGVLGQASASHGAATLSLPSPARGSYYITAIYSGDANDAPATSPAITTQILLNATSTTLTSSAIHPTFATPIALAAAVAPSTATGSITFFDGASNLGSSLLTNGIATFTVATLTPGSHNLQAAYSGDTSDSSSTSLATSIAVALDSTTTTLTLAQSTVPASANVIANIRVSSSNTNPTGNVSLRSGSALLASGPVANASNGSAYATLTFSAAALGAGQSPITAFYSGDPDNLPSDSSAISTLITVTTIATAATLTLSTSQIPIQGIVTLTAAVPSSTGSVTFLSNGIALATVAVGPSGTAVYTLAGAVIGTFSITAAYPASGIYAASTSAPRTLTVTPPLTAAISPTSVSTIAGATTTANLTLTPLSGFSGSIQTTCNPSASFITCTLSSPVSLSSPTTIPVQIKIAQTTASLARPVLTTIAAALLLPFLIPRRHRRPLLLLLAAFAVLGCAEGGNFFSIPPGAWTVTITTNAAGTSIPATLTILTH